jgi:gamma-tubulin complex component 3
MDYKLDVPISTIVTPEVMETYLKFFSFLWRIKRIEHSLNSVWRRHMNVEHAVRSLREIAGDLHKCHTLRNEMLHFISNLQYYIMFEVLEYSWDELVKDMKQATDLDVLIAAHSKYLNYINEKLFLTSSTEPIQKDLKNLLEVILRFCRIQDHIYVTALDQSTKKNKRDQSKYEKEMQEKWGIEPETDNSREEKKEKYQLSPEIKTQLSALTDDYNSLFKSFTGLLSKNDDENLRFLTFRFDFNGYYEKRERKSQSPRSTDTLNVEDN